MWLICPAFSVAIVRTHQPEDVCNDNSYFWQKGFALFRKLLASDQSESNARAQSIKKKSYMDDFLKSES